MGWSSRRLLNQSIHSKGGELHGIKASPRASSSNHFCLVKADHRLGQGVVVGVAHATHRRLDARLGQALGVTNRKVLGATVAVMDQAVDVSTSPQRLLQSVQARSVRKELAARPPTIMRAKTSMTKAT